MHLDFFQFTHFRIVTFILQIVTWKIAQISKG
jgi:hypothetical protein